MLTVRYLSQVMSAEAVSLISSRNQMRLSGMANPAGLLLSCTAGVLIMKITEAHIAKGMILTHRFFVSQLMLLHFSIYENKYTAM